MNGKAHTLGGIVGGPTAGIALSIQANRKPTFVEACGWVTAGIGGAKVPDILEPAFCPRHREFCHSGTVLVIDLAALQSQTIQNWIEQLHNKASEYHQLAQDNPDRSTDLFALGLFLRILCRRLAWFSWRICVTPNFGFNYALWAATDLNCCPSQRSWTDGQIQVGQNHESTLRSSFSQSGSCGARTKPARNTN